MIWPGIHLVCRVQKYTCVLFAQKIMLGLDMSAACSSAKNNSVKSQDPPRALVFSKRPPSDAINTSISLDGSKKRLLCIANVVRFMRLVAQDGNSHKAGFAESNMSIA